MYYYPVLCLFPPTHTSFMKAIRMEKERPTELYNDAPSLGTFPF